MYLRNRYHLAISWKNFGHKPSCQSGNTDQKVNLGLHWDCIFHLFIDPIYSSVMNIQKTQKSRNRDFVLVGIGIDKNFGIVLSLRLTYICPWIFDFHSLELTIAKLGSDWYHNTLSQVPHCSEFHAIFHHVLAKKHSSSDFYIIQWNVVYLWLWYHL